MPTIKEAEAKFALEGHALEIFFRLLGDPRMGGNPDAAAREAIRLARIFGNALERAKSGKLEEVAPADPYAELDNAYCVNLPAHHHLNLMSRLMPKPGGRSGELVAKPDLDQALEECRKARRMTAQQRTANHKQCIAELEQEFSRKQAAAEQKRLADEEARQSMLSKAIGLMTGTLES
jgi:hypothetical protein